MKHQGFPFSSLLGPQMIYNNYEEIKYQSGEIMIKYNKGTTNVA